MREYDYQQNGAYAITICVYERRLAFGRVDDGEMRLNRFGRVADDDWRTIPDHYASVTLDEWVVMPNHIHGIVWILGEAPPLEIAEGRQFGEAQSGSLSIIGGYKSGVSREIGRQRGCRTKVWQRGLFEHIIRNDRDLELQREYIRQNPSKWEEDEHFPRG